jgi:hypothetical protein
MTVEKAQEASTSYEVRGSLGSSMHARDALNELSTAGVTHAVVVENGHPIGIATERALRATADERPGATVLDAMDYEAVHIEPRSSVEDTMRSFRTAAWRSLWRRHPFGSPRARD